MFVFGETRDSEHWAYQPIVRSAAPDVGISNPIDAYVFARLKAHGLSPSPEALPHTLLRRLHLDLTGLLPKPAEVAAYLRNWKQDQDKAYAEKVAELLDSPHFGEHWAGPWLDLARYGDSDGYLGDNLRPGAWVYRDWVISAINRDQPFDQFSIEQLAGDLLPKATMEQKIAAGFHRNSLKNTEAGADRELARTKQVVDRVNTTGTVWLGLTVGCAECHDHKHDAISQKEFYQLYAFFNNTDDADLTLPSPPKLRAQSFAERTKDRRANYVHLRGDYARKGEPVSAGTPAVLHPQPPSENLDRLSLAHWLFDEANPLTARVAANRIWQQLFGVGLVSTSDDFGTEGARPTHPELLDWLATEYRRLGWSRKAMIRTVVTSKTYRQSSAIRHELAEHPTGNSLLWRQNSFRVSAEAIRDIHLAASDLLTPTIGGPGVYPPLPEHVKKVGRSVKWPISTGPDRYRRGIYIFLKRTVLYPMLTAFDAPDTSVSCSRRERTNTPMQALTLLNDPVFFECAESLGRDLHARHGTNIDAAICDLFVRCLSREPTPAELAALTSAHTDFKAAGPDLAMIATARIVLNLDEFVTRD